MAEVSSHTEECAESFPSWLSREYFESVVREKLCDDSIVITRIDVAPAAEKGEHFLCAIYRIQLEYKRAEDSDAQRVSYVVKARFENKENQTLNDALETQDVLGREMFMYSSVLPKLSSILADIGQKAQLVPEIIRVDYRKGCIIFEDLCYRRFKMCDKMVGLDLEHIKLALKRLAAFNAAAAKLNEIEEGSLQKFNRCCFSDSGLEPFFTSQMEACGRAVQKWKGFEGYGDKLLALAPKIMEYGRRLFEPKSHHFNTLIHGDFWINNMMFRYDANDQPIENVLIDFQFNSWTSPAIDLHYFLKTSVNEDLKWDHEQELVRYYHNHLAEDLNALQFKGRIPTFQDFWSQFLDNSFNEVTSVCIVVPLILNEQKSDSADLLENDDNTMKSKEAVYNQTRIKTIIQKHLPSFDKRGLLD
ncbi:unnamed protein product [Hermetia illucens]|uniref:CHK kinase-like domain-containing protein n=1 Tax=Hermetia illucens TaxID=343691 RepID=A0A7R8Z231_HERIL|nr:uncharacterized protein LOC119660363 [Hermetia illucens]CAD7093141.1 unnamed protein product [Hermetia illucens]